MPGSYPSITPQELVAAGQSLYGAAWRAELAAKFGVDESDIVMVETGAMPAPKEWRAVLVALAQDTALRAMETASNLMWRGVSTEEERAPAAVPTPIVRLT